MKSIWLTIGTTADPEIGIEKRHHAADGMPEYQTAIIRRSISDVFTAMGVHPGLAEESAAALYDGAAENRWLEIATGITATVHPCHPESGVNLNGTTEATEVSL